MRKSFPDRIFKIWDYAVGMKQLLIRSSTLGKENIDLIFYGVSYLDCPMLFRGLAIDDATEQENIYFRDRKIDIDDPLKLHVLVSLEKRYFIVSTKDIILYRNKMDYTESSLDKVDTSVGVTGKIERF